jgi:Zn-dependent hydrolases, including glyoxylases
MAEVTLTHLAGSTFVARGPTNIGVYAPGADESSQAGRPAALIDSGNDDDAGRRILRACEAAGLKVALIANTHSNADHCGANALVQARTGCRVAAPRLEAAFIESPSLEPALLWGGYPLPPLRNKFLVAKASRVTDLLDAPCDLPFGLPGLDLKAIPLPGHYVGQVGYLTPDRVFFAADAAASPEILAKHRYYYVYDVAAHLATLDMIGGLDVDWIVPSHCEPVREAGPLVAANKVTILEIGERILGLLGRDGSEPATPEALVFGLADDLGLELNHTQYALLTSTVHSYIAWHADAGRVVTRIEKNRLYVEKK